MAVLEICKVINKTIIIITDVIMTVGKANADINLELLSNLIIAVAIIHQNKHKLYTETTTSLYAVGSQSIV